MREWSFPLEPAASEPNLFSLACAARDEVPVHYSRACLTNPSPLSPAAQREAA